MSDQNTGYLIREELAGYQLYDLGHPDGVMVGPRKENPYQCIIHLLENGIALKTPLIVEDVDEGTKRDLNVLYNEIAAREAGARLILQKLESVVNIARGQTVFHQNKPHPEA